MVKSFFSAQNGFEERCFYLGKKTVNLTETIHRKKLPYIEINFKTILSLA